MSIRDKMHELKVGDVVVVRQSGYDYPYLIVKVEAVTKTTITAGGEKYNRNDGTKWGYGSSSGWYRSSRATILPDMTVESAEKYNKELQQKQRRRIIVVRLNKLTEGEFANVSLEEMEGMLSGIEALIAGGKGV